MCVSIDDVLYSPVTYIVILSIKKELLPLPPENV